MTHRLYRRLVSVAAAAAALTAMAACQKVLAPAAVEITDRERHYYPVIQGETLGITYEFENISDNTLFIQEVQTTCGCLVPKSQLPLVVLPHRTGYLDLSFNTIKNTGYVTHYVWCYGNFADSTWRELKFDTNVVPSADYIRDYEQLYHEKVTHSGSMRDFVDGKSSDKGYYTDDGGDPRDRRNEEMQERMDGYAF